MKTFVGIDLGSTTTKAVIVDENLEFLGRGITNSRSNYDTATSVAKHEAIINARLTLLGRKLTEFKALKGRRDDYIDALQRGLRRNQFLGQLDALQEICHRNIAGEQLGGSEKVIGEILDVVFRKLRGEAAELFLPGAKRKSDFFRDIAGSRYMAIAEQTAREADVPFDFLLNVYDKAIIVVESQLPADGLKNLFLKSVAEICESTNGSGPDAMLLGKAVDATFDTELEETYVVGTGYGRVRLPFSKEHIRSEILCHGLGAHLMYKDTRTVLDIGGQDTKAIQIDAKGIVENFQMNDRCAAGCGRYLGYIADEMNIGLHELGPMAQKATKTLRINSTCTVFAGAEFRDRLALGEKREDILAGLHRAIILRAMSIVSRSGGITDQFTFTGGVAKNGAAVDQLRKLVRENYGDVTINIDPDSIYTGAIGAATFAQRAVAEA